MLVNTPAESRNISQLVTSVTWTGNYKQAARRLEFAVAVSPTDRFLPRPFIGLGNMVKFFTADGVERFRGYVFFKEKSSSGTEMRVTAYDGGVYLLKSKMTFNFKNMTPAQITQKVCQEVGITTGELANPGIPVSFIADSQSLYDIIMTAYNHASRVSGINYISIMRDGNLSVIQKGKTVAKYTLASEVGPDTVLISESAYSESIEGMVNRVKIYDDEQNEIGVVENADWIKHYGVLQDAYTQETDKNPQTVAKNMLRGVDQRASVQGIGNIECITGRAVTVKEPYTGLNGLFYIDSDEHIFEDGQHMMSLELNFKNMMDAKEGL